MVKHDLKAQLGRRRLGVLVEERLLLDQLVLDEAQALRGRNLTCSVAAHVGAAKPITDSHAAPAATRISRFIKNLVDNLLCLKAVGVNTNNPLIAGHYGSP